MDSAFITTIETVARYAEEKHRGQVRNYTNEPYINHPRNVAVNLWMKTGDVETVIAGYLHDVVEDTGTSIEEIERLFGKNVAEIVKSVTKPLKSEEFPNRRAIHKETLRILADASAEAQNVKLADIYDNLLGFEKIPNEVFAQLYLREKREEFQVLTKGTQILRDQVRKLLEKYYGTI